MTMMQKGLNASKKAWAARQFSLPGIIFSLLFAVCLLSGTAAAEERLKHGLQAMTYDVYAGGFHVVAANLDVDLSKKNRYRLELGAHTRGFLGALAPWKGTFRTDGWYEAKTGKVQPQLHVSTTTWREDLEVKEYHYNKDGSFKEYRITDEHSDAEPRDVEKELTDNSTDALTATLAVMQRISEDGQCEGSSEVFDGKRRYRMIFVHQENVELQSSRYNVYNGPATECTVEVEPMAGLWHKKPRGWMSIQEQGRERGTMPTVWLAKIQPDGPAVPVKIRVKTEYGVLFMHLIGYKNGQTQLALKD